DAGQHAVGDGQVVAVEAGVEPGGGLLDGSGQRRMQVGAGGGKGDRPGFGDQPALLEPVEQGGDPGLVEAELGLGGQVAGQRRPAQGPRKATTRSVTYSSEVVPVECRIRSSRPRTAPWASAMSWPVRGGGWTSVPVMVSLLVMGWGGCARCRRVAGCVARRGR